MASLTYYEENKDTNYLKEQKRSNNTEYWDRNKVIIARKRKEKSEKKKAVQQNLLNRCKSCKKRLGNKQNLIKWLVTDVTSFKPERKYDLWHDRAAFHFLTNLNDIKSYIHSLNEGLKSNASFLIACFSQNGPLKCSGIEIKQYSKQE